MTIERRAQATRTWSDAIKAGLTALESGNLSKAVKDLEGALELAGAIGTAEPIAESLLALADAYWMSGDDKKANDTFTRALDFSSEYIGPNSTFYAFSHAGKGRLLIHEGDYQQARFFLESAYKILRRNRSYREPDLIPVYLSLCTCYLELQEFENADKVSRYCYDLSKTLLGPTDAATVMAMTMCLVAARGLNKQSRVGILNCQIRTLIQGQDKNKVSDHFGIAPAMLRQLNREQIFDTRTVVFSSGGKETRYEREVPTFNGSSTKTVSRLRYIAEPSQPRQHQLVKST
ncbi:hypothetical protein BH11CYA1_BH11CYA1_42820 [soil metagenome]